jgi:hypothetical protein
MGILVEANVEHLYSAIAAKRFGYRHGSDGIPNRARTQLSNVRASQCTIELNLSYRSDCRRMRSSRFAGESLGSGLEFDVVRGS